MTSIRGISHKCVRAAALRPARSSLILKVYDKSLQSAKKPVLIISIDFPFRFKFNAIGSGFLLTEGLDWENVGGYSGDRPSEEVGGSADGGRGFGSGSPNARAPEGKGFG